MSNASFKKMNDIEDLIQKTGKRGMRLLVLFKLLKVKVKERIRQRYPSAIVEEKTLDKLCIQKAHELTKLRRENPTEKDLEDLLSALWATN